MTDTAKLQRDIKALVGQPAKPKTLPNRDAAAPLPTAVGSARPRLAGSQTAGNGGIAGPLTEPDAAERTYHATPINMRSAGGLITIKVYPPQTFKMQDGLERPFDLTLDA